MRELKPCPFCGGRAEVESGTDGARIRCAECGISTEYIKDTPISLSPGGIGDSRDFRVVNRGIYGVYEAIEVWNKRA